MSAEFKHHRVMIHPQPIADNVALECSCGWREVHGDHREGDRERAELIAEQHAAMPPYEVKTWPEMTDFSDLLKRQ